MDSMVFKYKHHHHQQHFTSSTTSSSSSNYHNNSNNHNNNNQNSIFILNTATNNILPNNPKLYYADLNDNNNVATSSSSSPLSSSSFTTASSTNTASSSSSSVWSSASSTMCSPAANAIQKLFNCSSNSLKLNHGNHSGIDAKPFKSKSELLKKKTKFWKYLEGEANDKNNQRGIEEGSEGNYKKLQEKSLKTKSKYWSKSSESDNQNTSDLSELLEYSCSLCDNCRCMDCQIGYFDCENSDDSNSEYSFHLSAYEEDEQTNNVAVNQENPESDNQRIVMELKTETDCELEDSDDNCCNKMENKQHFDHKIRIDSKLSTNCTMAYCVCNELNCTKAQCCQQCWLESMAGDQTEFLTTQQDQDH